MNKPLRQNNKRMRSMGGIVSYGCWCILTVMGLMKLPKTDQNKPLILVIYSSSDREVSTGYLVSKTLTVSIDYSSLEEASSRVTFYQIYLNSI